MTKTTARLSLTRTEAPSGMSGEMFIGHGYVLHLYFSRGRMHWSIHPFATRPAPPSPAPPGGMRHDARRSRSPRPGTAALGRTRACAGAGRGVPVLIPPFCPRPRQREGGQRGAIPLRQPQKNKTTT